MKYRISNRVFWAGVFLAGCAILSGRVGGQSNPDGEATFERLFVREIYLKDTKTGKIRGFFGFTSKDNPDGTGIVLQSNDGAAHNTLHMRARPDVGAIMSVTNDKKVTMVTALGSVTKDLDKVGKD
jgi:hypothetical protein